jgi:predicted secreted protein
MATRKEEGMKPVLAALALLIALPAFAQDKADPNVATITLRAQAEREVANDQVVVVVAAEETGADPALLSAAVNRKMNAAAALVRAVPAVKSRSGGYQTTPLYKDGRIESWRVSQQLRLESADFAAMAQLTGRLQRELVVRGMSVGLAAETRRSAEDALIAEAIAAFRARAEIARLALKAPAWRVRSLDVGTGGGVIRPLAMEMAATRARPAEPAMIEGGVSSVTVAVSGTIELR